MQLRAHWSLVDEHLDLIKELAPEKRKQGVPEVFDGRRTPARALSDPPGTGITRGLNHALSLLACSCDHARVSERKPGPELARLRKNLRLTQTAVAEAMGVTRQRVGEIELLSSATAARTAAYLAALQALTSTDPDPETAIPLDVFLAVTTELLDGADAA